jgi:hypothetical protein
MLRTPPPIGAPPIDVPQPAAVKTVSPGTLSLDDITGRKKELVEEDPYLQIDVLGPSAPKVIKHNDMKPALDEPALDEPVAGDDVQMVDSEPEEVGASVQAEEPLDQPEVNAQVNEAADDVEPEVQPEIEPEPRSGSGDAPSDDNDMDGLPEGVHILQTPDGFARTVMPTEPSAEAAKPKAESAPDELGLPAGVTITELAAAASAPASAAVSPAAVTEAEAPVEAVPAINQVADTPAAPAPTEATATPTVAAVANGPVPAEIAAKQAEQEIEDLLSVSLIHPDRRTPRLSDASDSKGDGEQPIATGRKVIQPLPSMNLDELANKTEPGAAGPVAAAPAPVAAPEAAPAAAAAPDLSHLEAIGASVSPIVTAEAAAPAPAPAPAATETLQAAPTDIEMPELPSASVLTTVGAPAAQPTIADIQFAPDLAAAAPAPTPAPAVVEPNLPPALVSEPEAAAASPHLAGSAIMPQAPSERTHMDMPSEPAAPQEKIDPKNMASGEVFVDQFGNVTVGGS